MFNKINQIKLWHDSHSEQPEDAPDRPPTLTVSIIVFVSFFIVFVCIAIAFPITEKFSEYQENQVNLGMGNSERIVYISNQKKLLSSFQKIDENYYQIPISQAMQLVVDSQGDLDSLNVQK